MKRRTPYLVPAVVCGTLAAFALLVASRYVCLSAWSRFDVVVDQCPDGDFVLGAGLSTAPVVRGAQTDVVVTAHALYGVDSPYDAAQAPVGDFDVELALVVEGKTTVLAPVQKPARGDRGALTVRVAIPKDVPDGDHVLRAKVRAALGEVTVDAPLPLFAPAKVHLLTDRPLYEPGHVVKMRAVVLRADTRAPIDGRPGKFVVVDPEGTVVLDERAPAGPWGVAASSFAIDAAAPEGTWLVRWESGGARAERAVRVEPFTLPRLLVDVAAERPFYRPGQKPIVKGRVKLASGAPAPSTLRLSARVEGAWPPPSSWEAAGGLVPVETKTDAGGAFELALPVVPPDLQGTARVVIDVDATDDTGDRVAGQATVLLAERGLHVDAIPELPGGLVQGFDNKLWLRASTPAGDVLRGATLRVKRAWDPADPGTTTTTDEDGVAVVQLDPGPAVNVVIPAPPYRAPPPPRAVERTSADDLASGELSLPDVAALDRWNDRIAPCRRFADGEDETSLTLFVDAAGAVRAHDGDSPLERCVGRALDGASLTGGAPRLLQATWTLRSDQPTLSHAGDATTELPGSIATALSTALLDARECVPRDLAEPRPLPRAYWWRVVDGRVAGAFERDPHAEQPTLRDDAARCVEAKIAAAIGGRALTEQERADPRARFGFFRVDAAPGYDEDDGARPVATTMLGYELLVEARSGEEVVGDAVVRLPPGAIPPMRVRARPVVAARGGVVEVSLFRGPDFDGELPKKLHLSHAKKTITADLDPATRTARFTLPADLDGWFEASFAGATARVFVPTDRALDVAIAADAATYKPGAQASIELTTTAQGQPVPAAVGLFGVDETLATLAPLPGPEDLQAALRVPVDMSAPAFGALEATALVEGRVRGAQAREAVVHLVTSLPPLQATEATVYASGTTTYDPLPPLVERFYATLSDLHARVRAWEASAPKDERMTPAKMVVLWGEVLDARAQKGDPVVDAFGRRLELRRLPDDLLSLVDPRAVVVDGKRLPEDVENFLAFVRREK